MKYGELSWNTVSGLTGRVAVLPLGSLEQHGHHLPLLTDTLLNTELCRRAERELGEEALFLPVLWVGASHHHLGHPGTVSLPNTLYVQVVEELLECLIHAGFRRIVLLNSHGGNIYPAELAALNVQLRHHADKPDLLLALATWSVLASAEIAALDSLDQKFVTHACELETSMVLRLRPELVDLGAARGTSLNFDSNFYVPDFSARSRVSVPRSFHQLSVTGAFGHPEVATPEKGEALYQVGAAEIVKFVREFAAWPPIEAS